MIIKNTSRQPKRNGQPSPNKGWTASSSREVQVLRVAEPWPGPSGGLDVVALVLNIAARAHGGNYFHRAGMSAQLLAQQARGVGAGWVNTARLPISSRRACSPASSRSTDESRRPGSAVIATNTRSNRSISASMLPRRKHRCEIPGEGPVRRPGTASTVSG